MNREHGLTLLDSEMQAIIHICKPLCLQLELAEYDAQYQKWLDEIGKDCDCSDGPCPGIQQGGMCDSANKP